MDTCNMYRNLVKVGHVILRYASRQTYRQTHRHADRNTSHLSQSGEVMINLIKNLANRLR